MSKKRRAARPVQKKKKPPVVVHLISYEITWDPLPDACVLELPDQVRMAIERLHDEIQTQPLKTIPELLGLIEQYPDVPLFYNYLSNAYYKAGRHAEAEKTILENCRRNPDYLFGRLNYAELCYAKCDYDQIAEIFDRKFDLKTLYPQRTVFHISEVSSFMGIIGAYFMKIGERHPAEVYYDGLKELAPDHPLTKRLHGLLHPSPMQHILQRLEREIQRKAKK